MKILRTFKFSACLIFFALIPGKSMFAQAYPNPYAVVENWASLPDGRVFGAVGDIDIDPDGEHIWVIIRCEVPADGKMGYECLD